MNNHQTNIRRKLKVLNISQTELSRKMGISVKNIHNMCVNGIKTIRVARRYAKVLGCSPFELLD